MCDLREILQDNNILFHKEMEEREHEYFTVEFKKTKGGIYVTDKSHPLLRKVKPFLNIVENKAVFTQFEFEMVSELLKLEQANVIIKE